VPSLLDPGFDPATPNGTPLDVSGFVPGGGTTQAAKKTDWKSLAPLLTLLTVALPKVGKVGGAALLRGFTQSESQRHEQDRQRELDGQNAEYRQSALSSQAGARRDAAASAEATRRQQFLDKLPAGFETLDSPEAVEAYLALQTAQGATLGIDEQAVRAMAPPVSTLQVRAAKKKLAELEKQHGAKLMEAGPQFTYRLPGEPNPVSFDELLSRAGQARDPNYQAPPPEAGDLSKSGLDVQLADAMKRAESGDPKAVADVKRLEAAIAKGDALRRDPRAPVDPSIGVMRELQIEMARKRLAEATTQMPAATVRRIDAKARGFDQQQAVKNAQLMAEAGVFADGLNINTKNPADDIGLIYAFAKAMDPNSVVREGEYATVQKYAQTWADTFKFSAQRIFSNVAFLTPDARMNMKKVIRSKFLAGKGQYDALRKSYADQINKITGAQDGDSYLTDYAGGFPQGDPTGTTSTAGPPRVNPFRR
jgi:hypothetical protein